MIRKIERLVSIGKFRDYRAAGDVSFKKLTLIYGENGSGKTTLTATFRSLTQGNPETLTLRISTNHTAQQAVQIIQRGANGTDTCHTFSPTGWSALIPDIEIFDIHFINENIYSGFDFNDEHKKQLHEFVIGAQGVTIKQNIEQNKINKRTSRETQTNLENQLIQLVGNGLILTTTTAFSNTPAIENENIDQKIETAKTALATAKANAVIQTLQNLSQLNIIDSGIDFDAITTDLQTTTQTIQDITLQTLFEDHCADLIEHSIESPENWLQIGFNYIHAKKAEEIEGAPVELKCPFCQQPINDQLDIIKAYTLRFNDEFNEFISRLQNYLTSLNEFNLEAHMQRLNTTNQTNADRVTSWTQHLPDTVCQIRSIRTLNPVLSERFLF